jgi:hypothetical protein
MLRIGADPEFFLKKDGKFVSAFGMVKGTKHEPEPVELGAVQVDGMALEFNINPASNPDEFSININTVLAKLRSMIPKDYDFAFSSVAHFDEAYMAQQPEKALELGCAPDYNAWTEQENTPPDVKAPFRTAAGHVHIGWTEGADVFDPVHFDACCKLTRQLDCLLGTWSLQHEQFNERRELYGKAGAFRPKPYGMEYRVLSNFWVPNPDLASQVFHYTVKSFNDLTNGVVYEEKAKKCLPKGLTPQQIIDTNDYGYGMDLFHQLYRP